MGTGPYDCYRARAFQPEMGSGRWWMIVDMIYVIGSGLSAVAAAAALVRRGCRPTILDSGLEPGPESLTLKAQLAAVEPENWTLQALNSVRRAGPIAANGIPRKLYFGSDYTFRQIDLSPPPDLSRASMYRSFAAGGFSNIWGAVIQPYSADDFLKWPVTLGEMSLHYDAIRSIFRDEYGPPGMNFAENAAKSDIKLSPSSQTKALMDDLSNNRRELNRKGLRFDYPELAVRATDRGDKKGCRYCGLCLHGCPYDCKYAAKSTLAQFVRDGRVNYVSGILVDRIRQEDTHLRIECRSVTDAAPYVFRARRVFMAAGLLETSRVIIESLGLHEIPFKVKHSDIFTLPILRYAAASGVMQEKLHTLCQLVAEIDDPTICHHPVHLQFYGYNDLYSILLARKLGWFVHPLGPVLQRLQIRLLVIFGYLHSGVSSSITLTLSEGPNQKLRLEGHRSDRAKQISRAVARKLFRCEGLRAMPFWPQLRLDLPGGGYHSGGIFPMRRQPGELETNRLGSLAAMPNVNIVDTSVFPEIPSAPIAFTAMANAHRIASEVDLSYAE
jgi:choline dehydrogenase-like flavoprotein